jgi:hypothetical protein
MVTEANRQRLQSVHHHAVRPPPQRPLLVETQPRHPPHQPRQRNLQLAPGERHAQTVVHTWAAFRRG